MKVRLLLLAFVLFLFSSCGNLWDDVTPNISKINISKINWNGVTNNVYYVDKDGGEFSITGTLDNGIVFPSPTGNDWFSGVIDSQRNSDTSHKLTFSFTVQTNDTGQDREIEIHFQQELLGFDRGTLTLKQSH